MNKPIQLSLDGDWENIVNNVERHNARYRFEQIRKKNRLNKMLNKALCFAMIAAIAVLLSFTGLLSTWVAVGVTTIFLCAACFMGGRIYEVMRR